MKNIEGSMSVAAEGGRLIILENGFDIAEITVPAPYFGADNDSGSTTSEQDGFCDKSGNSYSIEVYSSMYGGVSFEITLEDTVDEDGVNHFENNYRVIFEEQEPEFDPWEYFSPEDIETGYEKRLRWSKELIDKEFYEVSIIINVSGLETLMKDIFKSNDKFWFHHISDNELDTKILQFLKVYNLKDSFLIELMKSSANTREEKINVFKTLSWHFTFICLIKCQGV